MRGMITMTDALWNEFSFRVSHYCANPLDGQMKRFI